MTYGSGVKVGVVDPSGVKEGVVSVSGVAAGTVSERDSTLNRGTVEGSSSGVHGSLVP